MTVVHPTVTIPLQLGSEGDYGFTQLTAPGATGDLEVKSLKYHSLAYTITAIDTSVVLRAEGSLDGTNWFNLSADDSDTTELSNKTNAFIFVGNLSYIRGRFVSETGGTAAKVDFRYSGAV
jgi:hypothetical protein